MSNVKKNFEYGGLSKGILEYFSEEFNNYSVSKVNWGRRGIGVLFLIDQLGLLLKSIKSASEQQKKVVRALKSLEKEEILELREVDGKVTVFLKNINHPKIVEYSIKRLLDFKKKEKKWNGKWFLVFFDVPEVQRNKRNYLRNFLIKLGFYPYQKSVYLFPYQCEDEINLIKKIVEGAKYMKYIIAEKIEDESTAKEYFNLPS